MRQLTDSEIAALRETAATIGAKPESLYRLIAFESGWDPQAKNPRSSARGLIQFIDSTARDLGFTDSAELVAQFPTVEDQLLGPITTYLVQWGPYPNDQALFMAVFYPAAMGWAPTQKFPEYVQDANPGIATVSDYMAKVYAQPGMSDREVSVAIKAGIGAAGILLLAGAAVALWVMSQS